MVSSFPESVEANMALAVVAPAGAGLIRYRQRIHIQWIVHLGCVLNVGIPYPLGTDRELW